MAYTAVNEAWIVGAVRTPVGKHGGVLSTIRPDDLGALVLQALMERTGVPPSEVEDVYFGCANQAGEDNRDVARMSLLLAGFPLEVAGATVNRLCGSGLEAVANAARAVITTPSNYDLVIVDVGHFAEEGLEFCEELKAKHNDVKVLMQVDGQLYLDRESCPDKVVSKQDGPKHFVDEVERLLQAS